MKTTGWTITICGVISTIIFCGGISFAQPPHNEQSKLFSEVSPREVSTIQKTAVVAMLSLARARADIHRKSYSQALHELNEAERLARTIRQELSTSVVRNLIEITSTHLEYESAHLALNDLTPVYESLDTIEVYIPTDKARRHLDKAKVYLENNDKTGAKRELKLVDRSLITMEVELPLLSVEKYIIKAQAYLGRKDAKNADRSLSIAEQRAEAISLTIASPLSQAKNNLWLAFKNYSTSKMSEASRQLEQAQINLGKAVRSANERERQEANQLSQQVAGLKDKLNSRENGAEMLLQAIWGRSKALVERSADYLAAYRDKPEKTFTEDNNLIEAKLHVAYAETYQVTEREPDKASSELDKADSYLKKALQENPLADHAVQTKIRSMDKDILVLKATPERSDIQVQDTYESIIVRLSGLIKLIYFDSLEQKMLRIQ